MDAAFMLDEDIKDMKAWIKRGGIHAKTIGYVIHEDEKSVIVANEVFEDGTRRGLTVIPKGMITEIKKLRRY